MPDGRAPTRAPDGGPPVAGSLRCSFLGSPGPLAALHDVALLDLDGVVYVGAAAVAHAAESLQRARQEHGMRAGFVTNNAARTPAAVAEHLVSLGIPADPASVVTSAQAGARVLSERLPAGARVLTVGGPGVAAALQERGLVPVTSADADPAAVMQGYGPQVCWRDLAEASLALSRGALFLATNADRTIPTPRGRVLGNGALVEALRFATGVQPVVAGKPEPPLMLESIERTGARHPLVVGDRLDTDIEGATRSGIPALLVLTGVTDWQHLLLAPPALRPTWLARDLRGLLDPHPEAVVRVEGEQALATCGRARVVVSHASGQIPDSTAWVPDGMGDAGRHGGDGVDLEVVRALVALAWCLAGAGRAPCAPAVVG